MSCKVHGVLAAAALLTTGMAATPAASWVPVQGNVRLANGTPVCAMVLANGQYMFSCDGTGAYNLNVPLDPSGQITLFAFADGFAPFSTTLGPEGFPRAVQMQTAGPTSPLISMTPELACAATPNWVHLTGRIESYGSQPLCAMVLSNGQQMFTCGDSLGHYDLTVPVDENGQVTVFGFADGFQPYRDVFIAPAICPELPAPPSNVQAVNIGSPTATITWTDNSSNESGFELGTCPGTVATASDGSLLCTSGFTPVAEVGADVTSYTLTSVNAATIYQIFVRASNDAGASSSVGVGFTVSDGGDPSTAQPTNVLAPAVESEAATITWTDNSANEDGFQVGKCPGTVVTASDGSLRCENGVIEQVAEVGPNVNSLALTGLLSDTLYQIFVRTMRTLSVVAGPGDATAPFEYQGIAFTTAPAAPSHVRASNIQQTSAKIAWTDNSSTETGFQLGTCSGEVSTASDGSLTCPSGFAQFAAVGPNVTTYTLTDLNPASAYQIFVRAYSSSGTSSSVGVGFTSDTVIIDKTAPVANAGPDQTAVFGAVVTLDGTGSTDADGDSLTYSWSLVSPAGSAAVLSDPTAPRPTFQVDGSVGEVYVAQLIVNDGTENSSPDEVAITVVLGSPNPYLSNMADPVLLTPGVCGIPNTSRYIYKADYVDENGDVSASAEVKVDLVFSNGTSDSYISAPVYNTITGDGFSGTVTADNCLAFGSASWVDVTLTIRDDALNQSNSVTRRAYNPGNVP